MKTGTIAATLMVVAVLCYFLCPVVYALPLILVFGKIPPPRVQDAAKAFFRPIVYLSELSHEYRVILELQAHYLETF